MVMFHSYVTNYQRVYGLITIKSPFAYDFPMVFLWFTRPGQGTRPMHILSGSQWSILLIASSCELAIFDHRK